MTKSLEKTVKDWIDVDTDTGFIPEGPQAANRTHLLSFPFKVHQIVTCDGTTLQQIWK